MPVWQMKILLVCDQYFSKCFVSQVDVENALKAHRDDELVKQFESLKSHIASEKVGEYLLEHFQTN